MTCAPDDSVNVLLGYSRESVRTLERTGGELHVFDEKYSLSCALLSNAHFHRVSFEFSPILAMRLLDLAVRRKGKLMFLYAAEKYRPVLDELKAQVECRYIIKDQV